MSTGSNGAVYAAIGGNTVVMIAKFVAFALTGSGAMLSESIHSVADVSNQVLLALGIARSTRKPDQTHPYGYLRARYVWALISAVGIFFIGCGVTVTHGISTLLHPHPIEDIPLALGVLGVALVIEGLTLWVALRAVATAGQDSGLGTLGYLRAGPDPMAVAVVLEDSAAVLGIAIAAAALGLAVWTGDPRWDAMGSIVIGLLLGGVAVFLVDRNREYLLGLSIPPQQQRRIVQMLLADPLVESVHDVKATIVGTGASRFKAEIEFDGEELARRWLEEHDVRELAQHLGSAEEIRSFLIRYTDVIVDRIGDEVDRIERELQAAEPDIRYVDLEAD